MFDSSETNCFSCLSYFFPPSAAPSSCRGSGLLWRRAVPGYACSLCHVNSAAIKEGQSERTARTHTHTLNPCDRTRWAGTNCPHLRVLNKLETSLNTLHSSEYWIIHDAFKQAHLWSEEQVSCDLCVTHTCTSLCVCVCVSGSPAHYYTEKHTVFHDLSSNTSCSSNMLPSGESLHHIKHLQRRWLRFCRKPERKFKILII